MFTICAPGDAVRCTWLISSDSGFDSSGVYLQYEKQDAAEKGRFHYHIVFDINLIYILKTSSKLSNKTPVLSERR